MKQYLQKRFENLPLTQEEAYQALSFIATGQANISQIAAFITSYIINPITAPELMGFRQAMLDLAHRVDLSQHQAMDVCGTGGDGKDTFNISTTSAFVIAGTGQKVAKHGNHGVSSSVGSSTVLEQLGLKFTFEATVLNKQLDTAGICFLHAPLFHPAMRHVGPVRKDLGVKTFFNMLGPLLNPALVKKQLVGVYSPIVQQLYKEVLSQTDAQFAIIHDLAGYDEISLTNAVQIVNNTQTNILSPMDFGFNQLTEADLKSGDTPAQSAQILVDILQNKGTAAQTNVVLANAALALQVANPNISLADALAMAKESIESGKAYTSLKKLLS